MPATLAALAAALGACATRGVGHPSESAAHRSASFEIFPAEKIAGAKDPHDFEGKPLCQRCHEKDLRLTRDPNELCLECHHPANGDHRIGVVQKKTVPDLPLAEGGKLACHTCHDPHEKKVGLRKPFNALCTSCHPGH